MGIGDKIIITKLRDDYFGRGNIKNGDIGIVIDYNSFTIYGIYTVKFKNGSICSFADDDGEIELFTIDKERQDKSLKKDRLVEKTRVKCRNGEVYEVRSHTQISPTKTLININTGTYIRLEYLDNNLNDKRGYKQLDVIEIF